MSTVRAEHPSLEGYLRSVLTEGQLQRVLLVGFNQWDFGVAALAETALTLHAMGTDPVLALWAPETPLKDVGWTTSPPIASALHSPGRDQKLSTALRVRGLPQEAFPRPPLRHWRPVADLPRPSALHRSAIRELRYREAPVGRAILQVHPDDNTPTTDEHDWPRDYVLAAIRSYAWAYDQARALIEQRDCTAIVVFNGRFLHDSAASAAAEMLGLPVLSYDKGGYDTGFDLTIDGTHDWPALQRRMLRMYDQWPVDERDVLGSQWFEGRRQHTDAQNELFVGAQQVGTGIERDDAGVLVAYFSSSGDEIAELDLDWADYFHGQPGALQAVADICRELGYRLLVRTHPHKRFKPKRDVEDWHTAVAAAAPDIHLDEHSPVDSYTLMRQADVVVTFGSTTGVEAAYAGRPVIVMGPSAYDELGCAIRPANVEELHAALAVPRTGDRAGAISYGLMMMRRGFAFEYVRTDEHGVYWLGDIDFDEPRELVRHLSHALERFQRGRLIRRDRLADRERND